MHRSIVFALGQLLRGALLIPLVGTAFAQAPAEWRFFTYFPPNDKPAQLNKAFAEEVTRATGGRLKITVFAAGELPYKAGDVIKAEIGRAHV